MTVILNGALLAALGLTHRSSASKAADDSRAPLDRAHSLLNAIDVICNHKVPNLAHLAAKAVA